MYVVPITLHVHVCVPSNTMTYLVNTYRQVRLPDDIVKELCVFNIGTIILKSLKVVL